MGGSKNYRTASDKRGQAIDTSLRWATKEGIDHNLSERPRERRTKDLTKTLLLSLLLLLHQKRKHETCCDVDPAHRCEAGASISTTGDPPPVTREGREGRPPSQSPNKATYQGSVRRYCTVQLHSEVIVSTRSALSSTVQCNGPSALVSNAGLMAVL